jgi:hypothetical protein
MAYGYLGQNTPNQTVNNSGVFSITDSSNLQSQGKLGGSLELIEEQVISSTTSAVDFTDLKNYDVHFLTLNGMQPASDNDFGVIQFSNDGGSTFLSSGYQYAIQNGTSAGSFPENRSTSAGAIFIASSIGTSTSEIGNSYSYLYNLLNSSKYSFVTTQTTNFNSSATYEMFFGGGVKPTAETHNAIRVKCFIGNIAKATIKLYGVKQI